MPSDHLKSPALRIVRILIKLSSLLIGLSLAGMAIWAFQLGIDNNPAFGPKRIGMLSLGIGLVFWAAWDWIGPMLSTKIASVWLAFTKLSFLRTVKFGLHSFLEKVRKSSGYSAVPQSIARYGQSPLFTWIGRHGLSLSLGAAGIVAFVAYLWIFSSGRMVIPSSGTRYYSWLADAFRDGQLHLLIKPSPGLMSLPNPYDYRLRSEVNYIWDATLYDGKYFLYWGPIPGVFVWFLQWITSDLVRDSFLVLVFVYGTFVFAALLLRAIWRRFENCLPRWGYLGGLLAVAMNVPMVWLLTRPAVYEASIAGGQFFLMAGLYWAFLAITSTRSKKISLVLAGISWSLAAGTRVNLIPAIIFLSLMLLWRLYQIEQRKLLSALSPALAFILPLTVGAVILAGYNYARFNSIFEFGHRYQLTGPGLPANYDRVMDLDYTLPNLFNYTVRLPEFGAEFPFMTIPWEKSWPFFIHLPQDFYTAEPVAGVLWLVPVTGLGLFVFIRFLWLKIDQSLPERTTSLCAEDRSLSWLSISLAGSACIQLFLLLIFISSSLRYQADFTLFAIILSIVFISQVRVNFQLSKFSRWLLATFWLIASGLTAIFAVMVNISGYAHGFERNNPDLFQFLFNLFS